jgi:uncharacterized protein (TIGR00290 family)
MKKVLFNWSGGKDSSLCLYKVLQANELDVHCLLTSINEQHQRISMHGVRVELLHAQTESIGIPLEILSVPEMPTMEIYEKVLTEKLNLLKKEGLTASVFGDINLVDLRKYREDKLNEIGLQGIFPLWDIPTKDLIQEFLSLGFKTITTCVNEKYLGKEFVGRVIDEQFLKDLPEDVDPCGENGEFHTFVFDGPLFKKPIPIEVGEIVYRKYETPKKAASDSSYDCSSKEEITKNPYEYGFWYCDILLAQSNI